ncbi:GFA family protein [Yoonia sp. I 8.24]|uniref:GFA family protein n=1 Tax=Yoonia sp. I 8.24 TaxID=1537229 RepID=UPI001EDF3DF1|nr:GFA family protein [Yoonia sp. I 8.24]MCG3267265.1 GFA family protein [Yoonia sp. I 8.24]
MTETIGPFVGGCACGHVRYEMASEPMIVHGCHCRWCQRESGASFAVNALIESDRVTVTKGEVSEIMTPSQSGLGQRFARCPSCHVTLWTNYLSMRGGLGEVVRFVRVGTLDNPDPFSPDVHIFTSTKQPWVILPPDVPAFEEYFTIRDIWSPESLTRRAILHKITGTTAP